MQFIQASNNDGIRIHFHSPIDWSIDGDRASTLTLMGYALAARGRVVALHLTSQGATLAITEVNLPRPDVVEVLGLPQSEEACGFHVRFPKLIYQPELGIDVIALVANEAGTPAPIFVGRLVELPAARIAPRASIINPLMVTSLGRSGSTIMMALLSRHPEIIVAGSYPYEVRSLAWMLQCLRTQISPADHVRSAHPDAFEVHHPYWAGHNPYWKYDYEIQDRGGQLTAWLETEYAPAATLFWREQFERMCKKLAKGACTEKFYIEKTPVSPLRSLAFNTFPGARELFLVRDFRDVLASARRFNRKRGKPGFGRERCQDDLEWITAFSGSFQQLHQAWKANPSVVVRYEDLVTNPQSCCAAFLTAFGLDDSPSCVRRMVAEVRELDLTKPGTHMTSTSATNSIGRWRDDLTDQEARLLQETIGDQLRDFGYEL